VLSEVTWTSTTIHLDVHNDPRELMCAVPVVHRILMTKAGPARHATIGYTRKACFEASVRLNLFSPIVREISAWYEMQEENRTQVSNALFSCGEQNYNPDYQSFPVHFKKSVGLSPYIDGIIKMQSTFALCKEQCTALCFNVLTSESPFFFWSTVNSYLGDTSSSTNPNTLTPVALGIEFHDKMWNLISSKSHHGVPQRHQPHNGVRPSDDKVKESIIGLI
jgi:hypothetical protein